MHWCPRSKAALKPLPEGVMFDAIPRCGLPRRYPIILTQGREVNVGIRLWHTHLPPASKPLAFHVHVKAAHLSSSQNGQAEPSNGDWEQGELRKAALLTLRLAAI